MTKFSDLLASPPPKPDKAKSLAELLALSPPKPDKAKSLAELLALSPPKPDKAKSLAELLALSPPKPDRAKSLAELLALSPPKPDRAKSLAELLALSPPKPDRAKSSRVANRIFHLKSVMKRAYRNGTYVAFHAEGITDPTASDIKYYRMLRAWSKLKGSEFSFIDSHDKIAKVRDSSSKERLRRVLAERLRNSRNMVLILGKKTWLDRDWVPFEIEYAIDTCEIPIIAAYTGFEWILRPALLSDYWPAALANRINSGAARVIHVPFKREPLADAIEQFDCNNPPNGSLSYYTQEAYTSFGISIS